MVWTPTTDQILNLEGVHRRVDGFRFELLDPTGTTIGDLHPDADRAPVVSNDTARAVRRQLDNFHLPPSELADINVLADRVRPFMTLQNGAEYALGTFIWEDESTAVRSWGDDRFSVLGDRMITLNQPVEQTIAWQIGTSITVALLYVILQVLTLADLTSAPTSSATFGAPVFYPPGTNRLTMITEMAQLMGWLPPFFDRLGGLNFVDNPDLSLVTPTIPAYEAGTRIVADSIVTSNDLLKAPNRFVVYENSGPNSIRGTYEIPADAPHSVANRGFAVPLVQAEQGLNGNAAASKAARALASTGGQVYRWAEFDSTTDPRHETWDPLRFLGETWLELSWRIVCRAGVPMSHRLRKVY